MQRARHDVREWTDGTLICLPKGECGLATADFATARRPSNPHPPAPHNVTRCACTHSTMQQDSIRAYGSTPRYVVLSCLHAVAKSPATIPPYHGLQFAEAGHHIDGAVCGNGLTAF